MSEMILGQLFLITALGKIVTAWQPARWTQNDPLWLITPRVR